MDKSSPKKGSHLSKFNLTHKSSTGILANCQNSNSQSPFPLSQKPLGHFMLPKKSAATIEPFQKEDPLSMRSGIKIIKKVKPGDKINKSNKRDSNMTSGLTTPEEKLNVDEYFA